MIAAELLRRLAAGTAGSGQENGFTYGLLYAQEQSRAEQSRANAKAWAATPVAGRSRGGLRRRCVGDCG